MLNPITYTEHVLRDFLRYQLTAYPFTDTSLHEQMRALLSLDATRGTPLLRGPYVSLSRPFRTGARVADLAAEGVLHPLLAQLAPYENAYGHQEQAWRAIHAGRHTLVSTGTGSGKTECFLYPIISRCLQLRDEQAPPGISAVIIYPMNALAEDQLLRLRGLLAGTGVTFGLYVGKTPEHEAQVKGLRLPEGSSRSDYERALAARARAAGQEVHPPEERASREEMRTPGRQPRILLTNVKQLELLLTRRRDVELFDGARLDFLVFDEAHTFRGAMGAESACLVRRLRAHCGKGPSDTLCIATSATLADPETGEQAGAEFASRFFGVPPSDVELVSEAYQRDDWAADRTVEPALPGDPAVQLQNVLEAVSAVERTDPDSSTEGVRLLRLVFQAMTGSALPQDGWSEALYTRLASSEVVYQIAELLTEPQALSTLVEDLSARVGRHVPEEEVLSWLALGAVARREGRPLLRPVVHAFVRGVDGAAVAFPDGVSRPRLWLSMADFREEHPTGVYPLRVLTCTTCGQHYFEHHVEDFEFTEKLPGGGQMVGDDTVWRPLEPSLGGARLLLFDRSIAAGAEVLDDGESVENVSPEDETAADVEEALDPAPAGTLDPVPTGIPDPAPAGSARLWMCSACGALHSAPLNLCAACGSDRPMVPLLALRQSPDHPGKLHRCVTCGAHGRRFIGRYREPARPVRAVTVSDVHVLAQNMLQHAERRRLLVFADNRQDAAFQAGWMRDHARRFRLRALMHQYIEQASQSGSFGPGDSGPGLSVGDLVYRLEEFLDQDDSLSRALIPEVWDRAPKEPAGKAHAAEREYFLRIQILRELATGFRQRIGLEPWGRMRVDYLDLEPDVLFVSSWADRLGCSPEALVGGIASLLDRARRATALYDAEHRVFSRVWSEGDYEIQFGYLPLMPAVPHAVKLVRGPSDSKTRLSQWLSDSGSTLAREAVLEWGVPPDEVQDFLTDLWALLVDEFRLLVPVTLEGRWGPMPGCSGAHQVDAGRLRMVAQHGRYRCTTCQQTNVRPTPGDRCIAWRCNGTVVWEDEPADDYDLHVLDERYALLRPREHSAQIPNEERDFIERAFKGDSDTVNTIVCTPTLELGVDIGSLDAVLMRNVPPLPSNYWQRAGRAGRRHRMAVSVTYARPASHDRAYFAEPLKMLGGRVLPPSFNLRNPLLVRRHVHSTVLGLLHQMADDGDEEIARVLGECLPSVVRDYLFDEQGNVRHQPRDVSQLGLVIKKHFDAIYGHVSGVFSQGWPAADSEAVSPQALRDCVEKMDEELAAVVGRLHRRLRWALEQITHLQRVQEGKGVLDRAEEMQRRRCERLVRRLKSGGRAFSDAEGIDDVWTYGVLAAEGFLPGYGLDSGTIAAYHEAAMGARRRDWVLRRSPGMALREYVPGNLVYAAGEKYVPRAYHFSVSEGDGDSHRVSFAVDREHEAVKEIGAPGEGQAQGMSESELTAVPICDVDVPHFSHITDDETYRFQMPVAIYGYETGRHSGGKAYAWGGEDRLHHLRGVHLRLVNVGPASRVRSGGELGYPVCLVCGYSVSPLSSDAERQHFAKEHYLRCGWQVRPVGFYADVVADCITLRRLPGRIDAYTLVEALRMGASQVLEMEIDDLQVLVIGRAGDEEVDAVLYDPMPGGSGLLDQMLDRWPEVVAAAQGVLDCPAQCERACIDCLMTYRNAYAHRYFDRHVGAEALGRWGAQLALHHDIPESVGVGGGRDASVEGASTNEGEDRLAAMLKAAGFSGFKAQYRIEMPKPYGYTIPDFYFDDPMERSLGICIYLDGLSLRGHGHPETAKRDAQIRAWLRSEGYDVRSIAVTDLHDKGAMAAHFFWLGQRLVGVHEAKKVREAADTWFAARDETAPNG